MELSEIGIWKVFDQCELFFNEPTQGFFVKSIKELYWLVEGKWELKYRLGENEAKRFRNACISCDGVFLCYQVSDSEIVTSK